MTKKEFDPYHRWLGIPTSEQPANHYRLLGIALFEADADVIESAAIRQTTHVRSHALGSHGDTTQTVLNEIAEAKITLLHPEKKKQYDEKLRSTAKVDQDSPLDVFIQTNAVPSSSVKQTSSKTHHQKNTKQRRQAYVAASAGWICFVLALMWFGFGNEPTGNPVARPSIQQAKKISPKKETPEDNLTGRWLSTNEGAVAKVVSIYPDGTFRGDVNGGRWVFNKQNRTAIMFRSNWRGQYTLSVDGTLLTGVNQVGTKIWMIRLKDQSKQNVKPSPPTAIAPFDAVKAKEHQQAWANHLGVPVVTTNSIGMKLALIPPGEFMMGSDEFEEDEKPVHKVTLTQPFLLGVYEVTQEQYEKVVGGNPSKFKGPQNPVEQVSWIEAFAFCKMLSDLPEEKAAGRSYHLPSEDQWEYACRSGTTTKYGLGDDESALGQYAWYKDNARGQTHPVGQKRANAWGLYDMLGNVWERCNDWHDDYPSASVTNPMGGQTGSNRVLRGGSWYNLAERSRTAARGRGDPSARFYAYGFRVACVVSDDKYSTTTAITNVESKPVIREPVVAPIQGEYGFTHSNNTYIELRFNRDGTVNELMWTTVSKKQSSKRTSTGGRYIHVSWSRENGSWVYTLYWPNPGNNRHIQRIVFEDSGKIRGFHYGKNGELAITGTKIK